MDNDQTRTLPIHLWHIVGWFRCTPQYYPAGGRAFDDRPDERANGCGNRRKTAPRNGPGPATEAWQNWRNAASPAERIVSAANQTL